VSKQKRKQKVVASRSLLLDGTSKVTIRIRKPYESDDDNFVCDYEVRGLGELDCEPAVGVDSFQALFIAIEAVRYRLKPFLERLSWLGNENDDGFPSAMVFRDPLNVRLRQIIEIAERHHEADVAKFVADKIGERAPADVRAEFESINREVDETP
jgi:hypothetical protein